jgi:hypothetical protein
MARAPIPLLHAAIRDHLFATMILARWPLGRLIAGVLLFLVMRPAGVQLLECVEQSGEGRYRGLLLPPRSGRYEFAQEAPALGLRQ